MDKLKKFVFNALLLEDTFARLEEEGIAVRRGGDATPVARIDGQDFSDAVMRRTRQMTTVYAAFYALENALRELVAQRLVERKGYDWWQRCVPAKIKIAIGRIQDREKAAKYPLQRATTLVGYTTFADLAEIIRGNWDEFSDLFPSQAWIVTHVDDLERYRETIMNSGILSPLDIERLESIIRDWKRQTG